MLRPLFYERLQNQPSELQSPNQFLIDRDQSAGLRLLEATPVAQAFATVAPARSALKNHKAEAKGDLSCRPSIRQCALLYEAWVTAETPMEREPAWCIWQRTRIYLLLTTLFQKELPGLSGGSICLLP